ncbi:MULTISPECIES: hypothetical protein [unclassified Microbacterium]|uniref:hypothetical protein n=1 Tax=unclassified Microbacterium TaxID=2609290 RepID=UPI0028833651|nr:MULTISPECIES: hypothetical protein [unclassified Microbacterium]
MSTSANTSISLEDAAQITAIDGSPRYGSIFTLRRMAQLGKLPTQHDATSDTTLATVTDLEQFREKELRRGDDAISAVAEIERQAHAPSDAVLAWMASHGDARHGDAIAKRRLKKREKLPTSAKLRKLTPSQFAKAWREGGHGPAPTFD